MATRRIFPASGTWVICPILIQNYHDLSTIDDKQRNSAIQYLRKHASHKKEAEAKGKSTKPFFMHVNFMKCHNPTNPSPLFKGKSHENAYLDSIMEVDFNSGKIVNAIKDLGLDQETIVVWTTDNGPWIDAWPDAGSYAFCCNDLLHLSDVPL